MTQAQRVKTALQRARLSSLDLARMLNLADPRAVIRDLRKAGVNVCSEWNKANGKTFKIYWIWDTPTQNNSAEC